MNKVFFIYILNKSGGDMIREEQMIDGKIILKREKDCVVINKKDKTVEFLSVSYTFDEVLKVAHEIAETFDENE